jgi:hypothetical protein
MDDYYHTKWTIFTIPNADVVIPEGILCMQEPDVPHGPSTTAFTEVSGTAVSAAASRPRFNDRLLPANAIKGIPFGIL